jgi:hypothetical protein
MLQLDREVMGSPLLRSQIGNSQPGAPFSDHFNRAMVTFDPYCRLSQDPFTGLRTESEVDRTHIFGLPPSNAEPDYGSHKEYYSKVQYFKNLRDMLTMSFGPVSREIPGLNPVSHVNLRGFVMEGGRIPSGWTSEELVPEGYSLTQSLPTSVKFNLSDSVYYATTDDEDLSVIATEWTFPNNAEAFIDYANSGGLMATIDDQPLPWGCFRHGCCKARYNTDGFAHEFLFAIYVVQGSVGNYSHALYFYRYLFLPSKVGSVSVGSFQPITSLLLPRFYAENKVIGWATGQASYVPMPHWDSVREAAFDALPSSLTSTALLPGYSRWTGGMYASHIPNGLSTSVPLYVGYDEVGGSFYTTPSHQSLSDFDRVTDSFLADCYVMNVLSTTDAIDTHSADMKLNQFEASQDLFGVLALVDIVKALAAVKHIRQVVRQHPGKLLLELLDVLTNAQLMYSFAVAPTINDYQVIMDKASSVKGKIENLCRPQTIYGEWSTDLPTELIGSFPQMTLTVRSMIRLGFSPDVLLTVLPLRSAGLLPSLSTLWEIIPFSFVADWLFPADDGLEMLENTLLFQAFDVDYSVHTYKLSYMLNSDQLRTIGVVPTARCPEPALEYRRFERVVLTTLPPLLPSRLLTAELFSGSPKWETAGSLAYQIVRR